EMYGAFVRHALARDVRRLLRMRRKEPCIGIIMLSAALLCAACDARVGAASGGPYADSGSYSCPNGVLCDDSPVTGSPDQQVCGTDLMNWICTSDGWQPLGTACDCGGGNRGTRGGGGPGGVWGGARSLARA